VRGSRAKRRVYRLRAEALIRSFGPPSPRGRRGVIRCGQAAGAVDRSVSRFLSDAACRGEPARPAPLEPIEGAITRSPQRRDVVGQKHKAERKHPQAENRQDGEASADDQHDRLHPARQAAKEPPQPSLMVGMGVIIARGRGVRAQAPEIDSPATARNPWFSLCRDQSSARQARSTVFAAASSASTIAWICSGLASRPRRRS
jgi:hypothetical protein